MMRSDRETGRSDDPPVNLFYTHEPETDGPGQYGLNG